MKYLLVLMSILVLSGCKDAQQVCSDIQPVPELAAKVCVEKGKIPVFKSTQNSTSFVCIGSGEPLNLVVILCLGLLLSLSGCFLCYGDSVQRIAIKQSHSLRQELQIG